MYICPMEFASKHLEKAVSEIAQLPGIGKRTALRLALHLLKQPPSQTEKLTTALQNLVTEVKFCKSCHNISDVAICEICSSPKRDTTLVCVVEDIRDVIAIENTAQFNGLYHVLGGKISPIDGIAPSDLNIDTLIHKAASGTVKEIIFALSPTIEGDTTNFYIYRKLKDFDLKIATIARGVSIGDELEYADEVTLGRSILHRIPFENAL